MAAPAEFQCPMMQLLDTLAGKWAFPVLYRLISLDRAARFGELHRTIERITQKELTKHLREFEALGLVSRQVFAEMPPRVEYRITPFGRTLRAPLDELVNWTTTHGETLFAARRRAHAMPVEGPDAVHGATPLPADSG